MSFPTPPKITTAIPNNPFYSYQTWQVCGSYLSYIVGCGICVTPDGTITTWDDGCGIFAIVGGPGICAVNTAGVVEVSNTGVVALSAACGLYSTGGQEPTVGLIDSGVVPGSYAYPSITIDQKGRVTAAISRPATIRCDVITAKGDLIVGQAAQTGTALEVGSDNSFLMANSACALGIQWAAPADTPYVLKSCFPGKGYMAVGSSTPNSPLAFAPGADQCLLKACSAAPSGMVWAPATGRVADPINVSNRCGSQSGTTTFQVELCNQINPSRCPNYFVMLTGFVSSCSNVDNYGSWQLCAGDINSQAICYTTTPTSPVVGAIRCNWPIAVSYLFQPSIPNQTVALRFCVTQVSTDVCAGVVFSYTWQSFGF